MPEVRLYGSLRLHAEVPRLKVPGETVGAVLTALCDANPGLCEYIFNGDGLRSFVRVTVNGHDVTLGDGLETLLNEDDTIAVFPPIAGG